MKEWFDSKVVLHIAFLCFLFPSVVAGFLEDKIIVHSTQIVLTTSEKQNIWFCSLETLTNIEAEINFQSV